MKTLKKYIKLMITSHSGISSKRVCGVIGFIIILFVITFCTIYNIQAPLILETFIWAVCALLGIDSIMSPLYYKYKLKFEDKENQEN